MEVSHPDVWGEMIDQQASGRKLGAFEIASFRFDVSPHLEERKVDANFLQAYARQHMRSGGTPSAPPSGAPGANTTPAAGGAQSTSPVVSEFTVAKALDKSSPDLFYAACMQLPMDWAIVTMREQGDKKPYLVIEFQKVMIESFDWQLPGEGEAALSVETVKFSFETIFVKYAQQLASGGHEVPIMRGFNANKPALSKDVTELPFNKY
jgi:type VI protein secretion system component Hcp